MRLFLVIVFFICLSCDNEKEIERRLELYSEDFIKRKNISLKDYKREYYIIKGKDYTHYTLKYYKIIERDTAIIWFSRDDTADYFIQSNDFFKIHILGVPKEELE